ncbi:hypothetical protein JRQ81_007140 [Phrynocephalus forsythii]|uniref:G-protein coupled receptors family 1 profile domain-containing protein n=1 Tax=Phrynocephalus forsythii TaxID=171643 RepID=A0A9Q0XDL0_9SAUR|nr:hypothetical protein JRQ81_007140 [Phrynocephalus forsythii]
MGDDSQSPENCTDSPTGFHASVYAATYTILFIPGLLGNGLALWVLCHVLRKKSKAVVFMINLAAADLAHVLSLPLRMYYYIHHSWPFGSFLCQSCFYLKYLNMYASICFLTCISIQRYLFLQHPFKAQAWKCQYDVAVSAAIWAVVGAACLPLPILRSPNLTNDTHTCFADLGVRPLSLGASVAMVVVAELSGFLVPLAIIVSCTWRTRRSLKGGHARLPQAHEKRKAWRMILGCAAVFFVCFTPYHVNFPLFMMVKQEAIRSCSVRRGILHFHTVSLCLASLNCCLDPIIYYFMTSEFQQKLFQNCAVITCSRFTSLENSGTAVSSAEGQSEANKRKKNVLMAYFWIRGPHRLEDDGMASPLSS